MDKLVSFWPYLAIFAIFYFLMIRPQQKQKKKEKNFSADLKKGDKVVTKSGMYGKVLDIVENSNTIILETGAGKITFDRSAISMEMSAKRQPAKVEKANK